MQTLTFTEEATPERIAKVAAKLEKASKPCCMRCGRILTAKRDKAGPYLLRPERLHRPGYLLIPSA